jgi:hypothetical protein
MVFNGFSLEEDEKKKKNLRIMNTNGGDMKASSSDAMFWYLVTFMRHNMRGEIQGRKVFHPDNF